MHWLFIYFPLSHHCKNVSEFSDLLKKNKITEVSAECPSSIIIQMVD